MQLTELESNGLKRKFRIVVDAAQVNAQMESELRAAGERIKIPGFRPGYIPMKILQQRYGKSVQADVVKQVINQASDDALKQKQLRPAAMPKIDIENYPEGGDITFTMAFETFPPIAEPAFDAIELERKTFEVPEDAVDDVLQEIAERSPKLNRATEGSKAQQGNVVVIDFKGMIDGVAFAGGSASDFRLELGSGQFIAGFEEQLIGAKEGDDRNVTVTFPPEYHAKNLAGKEAVFAVKVKEILTKEAPAIDEEFAKARGFADLAALRDALRGQLKQEYDGLVRNQLKKQLFDILETQCQFELPESMVEFEFNTIWQRLKEAQARGEEMPEGKDEAAVKEEYRQIARRRVKLGLLLAEIGGKHNIQVTRDELSRAVWQQAGMFPGQEKQVMEFYRNHPERIDELRGPILEEKAVDFILGKVKFHDRKVSLEELRAADTEDAAEGDANKKPKKSAKTKTAKSSEDKEEKAVTAKPKAGTKKKATANNE